MKATDKEKEYMKQYYMENKKQIIHKRIEYYKKNKDYYEQYRKENKDYFKERRLLSVYGITLEEYNTLLEKQKGCCAICKRHQSFFKKALHVDHNHFNNKIRGLLCYSCNTLIGHAKEDIQILKTSIKYLKEN